MLQKNKSPIKSIKVDKQKTKATALKTTTPGPVKKTVLNATTPESVEQNPNPTARNASLAEPADQSPKSTALKTTTSEPVEHNPNPTARNASLAEPAEQKLKPLQPYDNQRKHNPVDAIVNRIELLEDLYYFAAQNSSDLKAMQGLEHCVELRLKLFGFDSKNPPVDLFSSLADNKNQQTLNLSELSKETLLEIIEKIK